MNNKTRTVTHNNRDYQHGSLRNELRARTVTEMYILVTVHETVLEQPVVKFLSMAVFVSTSVNSNLLLFFFLITIFHSSLQVITTGVKSSYFQLFFS